MEKWTDEHIDAYLLDQMSDSERAAFEKDLSADPELQSALTIRRKLVDEIQFHHRQKLKARFGQLEAEMTQKKTSNAVSQVRSFGSYWLAAASIVLILVAGWWFINAGSEQDSEALFQKYASHLDSGWSVRGEESACLEVNKAYLYYDGHQYQEAIQAFGQIMTLDSLEACGSSLHSIQLLQGISHLFIGETNTAIQILRPLSAQSEDGRWYLAMAYLKIKDQEAAKEILSSWEGQQNFYGRRVDSLLQFLE